MCEAMTATQAMLASAAMSGVGMLMQQQAQDEAAERQQQAINASLAQQDAWSRKAELTALDNAQEYRPEARLQRFNEARQQAGDSLAQSLVRSRETAPAMSMPAGRLSEDFSTAKATSTANQLEQAIRNAQLMGRMRGAGDMLTNEGITNANYATQLGAIARKAAGDALAAQHGIAMAGKPDGFQSGLGGLMTGIGMAGMQSSLANGKMFGTQKPAPVVDAVIRPVG